MITTDRGERNRPLVPVLVYHSVTEHAMPDFDLCQVHPDAFAGQMQYLRDHGYNVVPIATYAAALRGDAVLPERPVVLTFDDGFADFVDAARIMDRFEYPSTLYVATAYTGATSFWLDGDLGRQPMLDWDTIASLSNGLVEIAAHCHEHIAVDERRSDEVRRDIVTCRTELEEHTGSRVRSYAYPFGYHGRRDEKILRTLGFTSACAVRDTLSAGFERPLSISRLFVSWTDNEDSFARLLVEGRRRMHRHERVVTRAWRVARRTRAEARRVRAGREHAAERPASEVTTVSTGEDA